MQKEDIDSLVMLIGGLLGGGVGTVFIVRRKRIAEWFTNEFRSGYGRIGPTLERSMSSTWMAFVGFAWLAIAVFNLVRGVIGVVHWLQ
ncbi:hypothetical protein GCM10027406_28550 [Leifsonia lichenia]